MADGGRIANYALTRFHFDRVRPVGDSQVRADRVSVVAVELIDERGRRGLGFAQALFTSLPEEATLERVWLEEAWPNIEGRGPSTLALALRRVRGGNARRMSVPFEESIQQAVWDLFAQQLDMPLWQLLGGERRDIPVYASGLDYHLSDHDFSELFGRASEAGFKGFKIKVGHPQIERDLHRLDLLRRAVDPARPVMIDANEAWTAQETVAALRTFEKAGHSIYWMEDPIPREDFDGLRMIRRLGLTRVNAGEYLDLTGKRRLLEARACDMLNVHAQVGDVMRAAWLANEANVEVTLGNSFLELGVNSAVAIPGVRWLEYSFQNFDHLVEEPFAMVDGMIRVKDEPGHGLKLSKAAREQHRRAEMGDSVPADRTGWWRG